MAKNIELKGQTLEQTMAELEGVVSRHNLSESASERNRLKIDAEKLKNSYNSDSKINAYAECLETENPMLTFVKRYCYPVISVSTDRDTGHLVIKTEDSKGEKLTEVFNLWDFVDACEGMNRNVVAALDWKSKSNDAQKALAEIVQNYIDNGTTMTVSAFTTNIQKMFDSILMIPGQSGGNAVIFTSKLARLMCVTSGTQNAKSMKVKIAGKKSWQKQVLMYLHASVEKKEFTIIYCDDEPATETEAEAEATTEATAE